MGIYPPRDYGEALGKLLSELPLPELGPGRSNPAVYAELKALDHQALFEGQTVVDGAMADCCLTGLWLLHDYLDESHTLSQSIDTITGSYWHGIMHRREPDYFNAKYWFRRVGQHPVFEQMGQQVQSADLSPWDPFRFVDLCENAARGRGDEMSIRKIAQTEWIRLFDFSYQQALGK